MQSRYYDPNMGRFINAGAYASTGQGILGNNMFAYCNNNPINYVDYTGTRLQQIHELAKEWGRWIKEWMEEKSEEHYSRNELNNQVTDVNEILSIYEKQNEIKDGYHENTNGAQGADAKYNDKYLSPDGGHYEIIVCSAPGKDPYIVDQSVDPLNMGTYNYASNNQFFLIYWAEHLINDMLPYYLFGNTREDNGGLFKCYLE